MTAVFCVYAYEKQSVHYNKPVEIWVSKDGGIVNKIWFDKELKYEIQYVVSVWRDGDLIFNETVLRFDDLRDNINFIQNVNIKSWDVFEGRFKKYDKYCYQQDFNPNNANWMFQTETILIDGVKIRILYDYYYIFGF